VILALRRRLRAVNRGRGSVADPAAADLALLDPYSVSGLRVLQKLYILGRDVVTRDVPGDLVECGVCNGGSAAAIACAFRGQDRRAWLYDSFMGMPETRDVDGPDAATLVGTHVGSEERVREALGIARVPEQHVVIRKGWFQKSFQAPLPSQVAFLHVDCDWYDSVLLTLETFYDLVSDGGIIVLDDFGHWEGCGEAFYDFTRHRRLKPLLERFGHSQAFWVKGRRHNRDFVGRWEIP
jgi:O-methyltransferase